MTRTEGQACVTPAGPPGGRSLSLRAGLALLAIVLGALLVRLLFVWLVEPTDLAGDERDYYARAIRILRGLPVLAGGARAPVMDLYYAALFRAFGPSVEVARTANAVVGSLALIPIFQLGRMVAGPRVGLVAAAIAGLYPNFIAFSHYLWAETLFIAILTSSTASVVSQDERPALWKPIAAGIGFGLCILTREASLLLPWIAAGWLLWRRSGSRVGRPAAGLLCAFAIAVVLPWTLYLNRGGEPFALVTRTSYQNLYIGNAPDAIGRDGWPVPPNEHYWTLGETFAKRETAARMLAFDAIASRLPWWPLEKLVEQVPRFTSPTSFAVRRLLMPAKGPDAGFDPEAAWAYRFRVPWADSVQVRWAAVSLVVFAYLLVALAGSAGLVLGRRHTITLLFVALCVGMLAPAVVTFAVSRFRLPCMVFLAVGAANVAVSGRELWERASPQRRGLAVAVVLGLAAVVASRWRDALTPIWG